MMFRNRISPAIESNSLFATKLVKDSDGKRGRDGRHKQYLVVIQKQENDKTEYVVKTYWGRGEAMAVELSSNVVYRSTSLLLAKLEYETAVAKKENTGYEVTATHEPVLV
jgi:hypothetical protein